MGAGLVALWLVMLPVPSQEGLPPPVDMAQPGSTTAPEPAAPAQAGQDSAALPEAPPQAEPPPPSDEVPLSRVAWVTAGGAVGGGLLVGALTALVLLGTTLTVTGALFPAALDAQVGACFCMMCGLWPAQLVVLLAGALVTPLVAAPTAYLAARVLGKRRVPLLPLAAAITIPLAAGLVVATALGVGCSLGNCFATACGSLCFTSVLTNRYDWPQQEAEYYAFRRAAPFIWYGVMGAAHVAILGAMLGATGLSGAMAAWAATGTGRAAQPDDPVTPDWLSVSETPEEL